MSRSTVELLKAVLCMAAIGTLAVRVTLLRRGETAVRGSSRATFLALACAGAAAYFNFGMFHWDKYPDTIHYYDFYHYYIGAKYFPELGYTGLYAATVAVDGRGKDYFEKAGVRRVRQLSTNERISLREALSEAEALKARFSPERWAAFAEDIGFFQDRMPNRHWKNMLSDLGFNGTPAWLLGGRLLSLLGDCRSLPRMALLAWIDVLLMILAFACLYRAFGLETFCLAILFFGVNYFGRYQHIGGSFLRYDWLAFLLIGVSLLKLDRPCLGGALLAYAALLRIFPALFLAGVGIRAIYSAIREKRLRSRDARILVGAALGGGAVILLTLMPPVGVEAWNGFFADILPHHDRLTVKRVALIYPFIYGGELGEADADEMVGGDSQAGFYGRREARLARWAPAIWTLRIWFVLAFARSCVRLESWQATCLSGCLVYALLNPVRYYYAFLVILTPLLMKLLPSRASAVSLSALFALMILEYAINQTTTSYNIHQFVQSCALGLLFAYLLVEYAFSQEVSAPDGATGSNRE